MLSSRVEGALGAVLVEEAATGRVDEVAVVGPPAVHGEPAVLAAEIGDGLGHLTEGLPVPLARLGEGTRIVGTGLGDEVVVEVQREGRHVAGQAPQVVAGRAGLGVEGQVVHRLRIELGRVELLGRGQLAQVEDQALVGEAGDVGAGDPEHVGGGAVGDLGDQLVLVGRALVVARLVAEADAVAVVGVDRVADVGVDLGLGVVVGTGPPADLHLAVGAAFGSRCPQGPWSLRSRRCPQQRRSTPPQLRRRPSCACARCAPCVVVTAAPSPGVLPHPWTELGDDDVDAPRSDRIEIGCRGAPIGDEHIDLVEVADRGQGADAELGGIGQHDDSGRRRRASSASPPLRAG